MTTPARIAIALALLSAAACPGDSRLQGGCVDDAQCIRERGEGFYCSDKFKPKVCLCTTDSACGSGAFCNQAGLCQPRVGCETNAECPADTVCDTTQNQCIEATRCTSDLQCPIGTLCNLVTFRCEPGCRVNGDCPLSQVCRCPADQPECEIGLCKAGLCDDQSFCKYAELCEYDPAVEDTTCQPDTRGPYCEQCQLSAGSGLALCDQPGNYCLVDTSVPGGRASFCGVDCSAGQPCPNGFECDFVVILTQALCSRDEDCQPTGAACQSDDECPGGRCAIPPGETIGQCAGICVGHEGGAAGTGFCSCVQDSDCPQDTCDTTTRSCGLTRAPCQLGGDQCRGQLSCVNINGTGGCVIGKNCAPIDGVSCAEVRASR